MLLDFSFLNSAHPLPHPHISVIRCTESERRNSVSQLTSGEVGGTECESQGRERQEEAADPHSDRGSKDQALCKGFYRFSSPSKGCGVENGGTLNFPADTEL